LSVIPNMEHPNTALVFEDIQFGPNETTAVNPNSNLNSLGNKCAS
jgi:hypothetical protein